MSGIAGKTRLVLRILFGLLFFAAGAAKLAGAPMMIQEFDLIGFGQWFRYFTGLIEIAGALLLIRPRTVPYGALLLIAVSIGALIAQLAVLHQDPVHGIVFALLLAWVGWGYRSLAAATAGAGARAKLP